MGGIQPRYLCAILTALWAWGGCVDGFNTDAGTTAFSGLLDDLVPDSPTTSDNNRNESTGDSGDQSTGDDGNGTAGFSDADNSDAAKVVELVNEQRASGANCGSRGDYASAGPLVSNAVLTELAQAHSVDMSQRNYFDHTNPDGDGPGDRIDASTYEWSTWGENIAAGHRTPEAVVDGWMNSDGHCANIMNPAFTEIGVGYEASGSYWTQVFGAPR